MARKRRARKHRSKRHKSSRTGRRLLIGLGLTLPLLYFAFTRMFFDPFEPSQPSFQLLVPQDVDLFVHRKHLSGDFQGFPEPKVPGRWMRTPEWRELTATNWYRGTGWPTDMNALVDSVLGAHAELLTQDGSVDPLVDFLGQEVAVVGRDPGSAGHLAFMARLTPAGKLAVEALAFEGALHGALPGATRTEVRDPDVPAVSWQRIDLPDADSIFYARRYDLLVVGTNERLVRDILRTVEQGSELSLGLSRLYHDNLVSPSEPLDQRFSMAWFADLNHLVDAYDLAPDTVDRHRDALLNVLPRLIDWELMQEGIGRLEFDSRRINFTAHADLDVAAASDDKGGLLGAPAFYVEYRLNQLLSILPSSTAAVVTFNVDLKRFLNTITAGLDSEIITLTNGLIRDVARYNPNWRVQSLSQFIAEVARVLEGEISVAFRPLDHQIPAGAQPIPALAIIAKVRDAAACEALFQAFTNAYRVLGVSTDDMWQQDHQGIGTRKYMNLAGLAAEQVSFMVLEGETMVLSTDDDFTLDIFKTYTEVDRSAASGDGVSELIASFAPTGQRRARGNVAAWGDVDMIREMLEPYAEWTAELETQLDFLLLRAQLRRQLIESDYSRFKGRDELPEDSEAELAAKLDTLLDEMEARRLAEDVPRVAQELRERRQWMELLQQGAFSVLLEERATELAVHLRTAVR